MNKKHNIEVIIGTLVVAFCIAIVGILSSQGFFKVGADRYTLHASFERADGINIGNDVAISGVRIGEVTNKRVDEKNFNAIVTIEVDNNIKLPIDTSAEITSATLIGDKYISLVPGAETDILKNGDSIEFTQSSISLENLITKFFFGVDSGKSDKEDGGMMGHVQ